MHYNSNNPPMTNMNQNFTTNNNPSNNFNNHMNNNNFDQRKSSTVNNVTNVYNITVISARDESDTPK